MLEEMFKKARAEGLWFNAVHQDIWFSPDELEAAQAAGRFRWGAVNWELRDPEIHTAELERELGERKVTLDNWKKALEDWRTKQVGK